MSLIIISDLKAQLYHEISQTHFELLQVEENYGALDRLIGEVFLNFSDFIKRPSAREILFSAIELRSKLISEMFEKDEELFSQQKRYLALGGTQKCIEQIFRVNKMYFALPIQFSSRAGA